MILMKSSFIYIEKKDFKAVDELKSKIKSILKTNNNLSLKALVCYLH